MKSRLLFIMFLLFCTISSIAQNKMQLVGTWKLISGKVTMRDSTYPYDNKTLDAIKIVTPTHFAVISKNVTNDSMQNAGAGTVKMDDRNYTEEIQYGSTPAMIGKKAKFTYRIEGDKWF